MKKLLKLFLLLVIIGLTVRIVDEQRAVARLKDISPVFDEEAPVVSVSAEEEIFRLRLYKNSAAKDFLKHLPQTLVMTRWGEGAYGVRLDKKTEKLRDTSDKRRAFFKGEVVFYPKRNLLFLMFGTTPVALTVDAPMLLASGGIPLGRLESWTGLEQMMGVVEFTFEVK